MWVEVGGALLAGALTTLAPCSLSLLPVIVGGSLQGAGVRRPLLVTTGLGLSVIAFTLLLKASTALIDIAPQTWRWLSGGILIALGLVTLFPTVWERVSVGSGLANRSNQALSQAHTRTGSLGALLTGAALGPVFSSCSPLYAYVVVTVLPAEPAHGMVLLLAYTLGLVAVLLVIAWFGQRAVSRLRWAADPTSWLRRGIGALFILIGILIATALMLSLETWLVQNSPIRPWDWGP